MERRRSRESRARTASPLTRAPAWAALTIMGALGSSCAGSAGAGGDASVTCSPLDAVEKPTALAQVRAVGKHADGTLYVVDRTAATTDRVFVSEGGALWRKRIAGSGSGGSDTQGWSVYSITDATPPFTLKIDSTGGTLRMGVIRGPFDGRDFTIGEQGDELEVVGADALAGLALRNLPGTVEVEYLASVQDGRKIVVTRPTDDWTYDDFRLFLGTPDRMVERRVQSVTRAKDGGTTTIVFDLDGATATATFPSPLRTDAGPTLITAGGTLAMTLAPAGTRPDGYAFTCL